MAIQADQYSHELRQTKSEIADLTRLIGRVQSEIQSAKGQVRSSGWLGRRIKVVLSVIYQQENILKDIQTVYVMTHMKQCLSRNCEILHIAESC